ncbi:MAG TPA: GH3 auxin-responsive promoter family protein [Rhodothermales bacterium]|nr:GH3 auxin-responsive promoter family protein [Rhodothermales bacterium]
MTGKVLYGLPFRPLRTVQEFKRDPVGTQARLLRSLLRRAAETEWGQRYGFASIAQDQDVVGAYQARVPLHTYDDVRQDAARVRKGAADVFWPGTFRDFAVSSGTASAGKVIPVSRDMLMRNRSFAAAVGLGYLAAGGHLDALLGKHLTLPGRIEEDPDHPGTWVGEVSGLQAEYAPLYFRTLFQAVPNEVSFLPNWEQKLEAIAARTLDMDVRMLVMAPTWALVFFKRLADAYRRKKGRLAETVGEVWPNLRLFVSGGVALSSYRHLLEAKIGLPGLHFLETYGASEGFYSFQDELDDPSMLLHLDNGVFFEFVRMDELGREGARRYTVADVETDVRYAPFVSTCSGLWACGVGDVVRFTQTFPHKIAVAGRTNEVIDKYGEKVFGDEARAALLHACERTGADVLDFHIAPQEAQIDRLPTHQWLVEFARPPESLEAFATAIDAHLQDANRHYQIRREAQAFGRPEIIPVPQGTFYNWLKLTRKKISGQTKVPRMSEERAVADSVLSLIRNIPAV